MRGTEMPYERSEVTMTRNSKTLASKPLAMTWVLNNNFQVFIHLPRMGYGKEKQNLVRDGSDDARRA
jgi:hypothetical protein